MVVSKNLYKYNYRHAIKDLHEYILIDRLKKSKVYFTAHLLSITFGKNKLWYIDLGKSSSKRRTLQNQLIHVLKGNKAERKSSKIVTSTAQQKQGGF